MANYKHLSVFSKGADVWNEWRWKDGSKSHPDLSGENFRGVDLRNYSLGAVNFAGADLAGANLEDVRASYSDLSGANLHGANLEGADLSSCKLNGADLRRAKGQGANFHFADLTEARLVRVVLEQAWFRCAKLERADLNGAQLRYADFYNANLSGAKLVRADLQSVNFTKATLACADLTGADLRDSRLVETDFERATLTGARVYGVSAWRLRLTDAMQSDVIITDVGEATITTDSVEVAQFIYVLLNNERVRAVIDTITAKMVLILGRFKAERLSVLQAIRRELRGRDYLPVLFDFDKPSSRDLTETVSVLAHMSRFIIADFTDARSVPQELEAVVPHLPSVPVKPLLMASSGMYGMFEHFARYPWVLDVHRYSDEEELIVSLRQSVIPQLEAKVVQVRDSH